MSEEQGYNGWKNYETWVVALWIDNDEGSYGYSRTLAQDSKQEAEEDGNERSAAGLLADALKEWQEGERDSFLEQANIGASVWTDLLSAALSEVDWYEIAENYLSELVTS